MVSRLIGCSVALHSFATEVTLVTLVNFKVSFVYKAPPCSAGLGFTICLTTIFMKLGHSIATDIMKMKVFCELFGTSDNH